MRNLLQYSLLSPDMERIFPCEEGRPGGGADLLTVGLLQSHTSLRKSLHGGGRHVRVMPGHVIPAKVVSQDKNYIRRLFLPQSQLGETEEGEAETLHVSEREEVSM